MTEDIRVHLRHIRPAGGSGDLCSRGIRAWYQAHGLDYRQLVMEGTPVEVLEATGDAFAMRACELAREEADHGRRG